MCGICGFTGFEDKLLLKRMIDAIKHRGPDDSGLYIDKNVCLGHKRLSIIDLSGGHQPMHNEDESIWIVFNGEIYNYKELKKELESKHKFYTNSDTEVIIHLYEEREEDCVQLLNGMFAFAIWDSNKKILLLARDRIGIKPLYYTIIDDKLLFASEIKSIFQYQELKREINRQCLHDYLSLRYVPEPKTIIKTVNKLPPGHFMIYKNGDISIKKYWQLEMKPFDDINEVDCIKIFGELLKNSVERMLISDVPLGVYLSGGIDSGTIVGIMSKLKNESTKTFSIGYNMEGFEDELKSAERVANYFNTDHHEFVIDFNPMEILPKTIWHMDEPIADPAALPVYLLSKMAKKYVTVVLVGEGADECLAGYEQYKIMLLANKMKKIPVFIRSKIIPKLMEITPNIAFNKIFKYSSMLGDEGKKRAINFISSFGTVYEDYCEINFIFTEDEKEELYGNCNKFENSSRIFKPHFYGKNNLLNEMLLADNKTFLLHLLTKADKMTMAFGVEGRVPYLDNELVRFCSTLPQNLKLRGNIDKYILRKAAKKFVPEFVTKRKKRRFFVPIHHWLENIIKEDVENIFSRENIENRGYFDYHYIDKLLRNYEKSKLYYGRQLWNLLTLELWCRVFIDNEKIPTSSDFIKIR